MNSACVENYFSENGIVRFQVKVQQSNLSTKQTHDKILSENCDNIKKALSIWTEMNQSFPIVSFLIENPYYCEKLGINFEDDILLGYTDSLSNLIDIIESLIKLIEDRRISDSTLIEKAGCSLGSIKGCLSLLKSRKSFLDQPTDTYEEFKEIICAS